MTSRTSIVSGIATILWASAWADAAEESGNGGILSGQEITEIMPTIPERARYLAERLLGKIEHANASDEFALFARAMRADGVDLCSTDYSSKTAERFGECLAWMAMGAGVSWFDDHARFPLVVPSIETYVLRELAIELEGWSVESDEDSDQGDESEDLTA